MTAFRLDRLVDAPPRPIRGGVVASFQRVRDAADGRVYPLDDPIAADHPGKYLPVSGAWFDVRLIGRVVGVRILRSARKVRFVTGGGRVLVVQTGPDKAVVSWESAPDDDERKANAIARRLNHLLDSSST